MKSPVREFILSMSTDISSDFGFFRHVIATSVCALLFVFLLFVVFLTSSIRLSNKSNNYSVNGSRLAHQSFPSAKPWYDLCFCGRAYEMDANADMVIVFGGVNDYIHGDAPFGEAGDTTPATFYGGVYYLMNYLREIYGDKPIIFMTPARCFLRHEVDDLYPSVHAAKRVPGKPLKAYADVISETAKQFDIRVLDLYNNLGIDPHIPEQFEKYTTDGLHLNDEGHALLAQKLKELIESM